MKSRLDTRGVAFSSPNEKARYLDGIARLEAHQRGVKRESFRLARESGPDALAYLQRCHEFVRDSVRYRRDHMGIEHLADSETILARRFDDCDGKSRLFMALALAGNARGFSAVIDAAIRPIFPDPYTFAHVQAACRLRGLRTGLEQGDGWIVAELCLDGVALGSGLEAARWVHGRPVVR